jgi:phosphohistidine phosphatase
MSYYSRERVEMKFIILVRHAKAGPKDLPIPDKDRPLTQRGKKDLEAMRPALAKYAVKPEHIFSSSANRAAQTATIYAGFYDMCDSISFHDVLYHPDPLEIIDFARGRDDTLRNIAIVGHNPELEKAADLLWEDSFQDTVPTSACICLSFDVDRWEGIREKAGKLEYYEYPGKYG